MHIALLPNSNPFQGLWELANPKATDGPTINAMKTFKSKTAGFTTAGLQLSRLMALRH